MRDTHRTAKSSASALLGRNRVNSAAWTSFKLQDRWRAREAPDDGVLRLQKVGGVLLEALGPQMRAGFGVDELGVDPNGSRSRCTEPSST